ncbi:MAG: potassium-transporting ATPase subunit KdpA [Spirochaetota bacterium]
MPSGSYPCSCWSSCRGGLPFNPEKIGAVRWDTALNTAISFVTNTNWQAYGGETTMSYLTQMAGLTVHNFLSAATGIAALLAAVRGFTRKSAVSLGNFWVDTTRAVLYVLLPLALITSMILVSQGVVQTLASHVTTHTLEGATQTIAVGPAASQIAIKQLGSNGGGFFNANSAHPFENPTIISNVVETFSLLFLPAALVFMLGGLLGNKKQARAIFIAMFLLLIAGLSVVMIAEIRGNPMLQRLGAVSGVNMEGKEMRFGIVPSILWGQLTTATSNGSVNFMHDSALPLTGLVTLFNIGIGEVIFGGVGVGLIGMFHYIILTMFVAGLMVGRTPEFLGKKLGPFEMSMSMISLILPFIAILVLAGIAIATGTGRASLTNISAHGVSEILYACCSAVGNNGSAFAGLNANTVFYNLTLGFGMLIGRYATTIPMLAIAGSLANKNTVPATSATFPTTGPLFIGMLIGVIIIMGALTFFPVFSLGPILEHFLVYQ